MSPFRVRSRVLTGIAAFLTRPNMQAQVIGWPLAELNTERTPMGTGLTPQVAWDTPWRVGQGEPLCLCRELNGMVRQGLVELWRPYPHLGLGRIFAVAGRRSEF